jgi:hypothetical protein
LKSSFKTVFDESAAAIGKALHPPGFDRNTVLHCRRFCKTKEDNCVTIRHRDSPNGAGSNFRIERIRISKAVAVERILKRFEFDFWRSFFERKGSGD